MHLEPSSDWAGRLTPAAEKRALRWAKAEVTQIADMLIKTEATGPYRLMTADEAVDCRGLGPVEYTSLVEDAMPKSWKVTLQMAPERFCRDLRNPQLPAPEKGEVVSTQLPAQ